MTNPKADQRTASKAGADTQARTVEATAAQLPTSEVGVVDTKTAITDEVLELVLATQKQILARLDKIERKVNPNDQAIDVPEKKNYNPDYLPHNVDGIRSLDELPPKAG